MFVSDWFGLRLIPWLNPFDNLVGGPLTVPILAGVVVLATIILYDSGLAKPTLFRAALVSIIGLLSTWLFISLGLDTTFGEYKVGALWIPISLQ